MRTDTKLRREAEHLTLTDRAAMDGVHVPNAIIQSPSGKKTLKVNATPEALAVWERFGWKWRWLKDGE